MTVPAGLYRAWGALILLSIGSTALSMVADTERWTAGAGLAILLFAWLKARIVLARYMGLAAVPAWRRGFELCLGLFALLLAGLYLAPLML